MAESWDYALRRQFVICEPRAAWADKMMDTGGGDGWSIVVIWGNASDRLSLGF